MVNPLLLIAVFLATAFLGAIFDKAHRKLNLTIFYAAITFTFCLGMRQLWNVLGNPNLPVSFETAGFASPLSIVLRFGLQEAVLISLVNLGGLFGAFFLYKEFNEEGALPMALYLAMLLGANGLILTRDIFNSFVFLEILSISSYALLGMKQSKNSLAAGIKYMLAGGITSFVLLVGIVFIYRYTGTLNIDTWIALNPETSKGYMVALFMVVGAIFVELKPFPANGWALDMYQSVHSGIAATISTVNTAAILYLYYKLMPLFSHEMLALFTAAGLVSFVLSNLVALRQKNAKRLLGYSSTAQSGLVVFVLGALQMLGLPEMQILGLALALFITNFFAKSLLFWLSECVQNEDTKDWGILSQNRDLLLVFTSAAIALMALPPFPAFFAKWNIAKTFIAHGEWVWLGFLLLGSLFEASYLLRWLGQAYHGRAEGAVTKGFSKGLALIGFVAILGGLAYSNASEILGHYAMYPLLALVLFALIDYMYSWIKGFLAIGILAAWMYYVLMPGLPLVGQIFAVVLVGGGIVQIFAFMHRKAEAMFPFLVMLIFALGNLLLATSWLEFFLGWEFMTLASYFLILRGKNGQQPALHFAVFSTFGAYLLLIGLLQMPVSTVPIISALGSMKILPLAALFATFGFIIKMGAFGLHYWLPGAYSEADDESSAVLSSVLSKAGVYGMFIVLAMLLSYIDGNDPSMIALGWLGALTALFGALMAVFQEDAKKLLAYSSMSQMGYILLGLSLLSHLGWVSALYLTVNHLFFKALIFLAMAGVFLRTGTRNMYQMGGLIKKMPISYISVLLGIIAVSGVPPLSGFGSKWFIYTSLLESGRYLQAGVAFFASAVAFLYLYRLIHTVFLGQAKPEHKDVKEAPFWLIVPQAIFMMAIMAISVFPNLITKPLSEAVNTFIARPEWMSWNGYNVVLNSPLIKGNWNGNMIMLVTMGVFMFPLVWLLIVNAKTQKVKQFNIVYAAERPYKPSTTHYAYNMFAPYYKALGFLVQPRATGFYNGVAEWTHSFAATIARLYTGNGQTYMLHIFLYLIVLYLMLGVR